jgi:hypothetical protein
MHQSNHRTLQSRRRPRYAVTTMTAVVLGLAGPVFAEDKRENLVVEVAKERRSHDIVARLVTRLDTLPEVEPNWFRANIHTAKKHGFEYSRSFKNKDRETIIFKVKGPIIRKKTAGLTFEIRF